MPQLQQRFYQIAVEVMMHMSNYILPVYGNVDIYPCPNLNGGLGNLR